MHFMGVKALSVEVSVAEVKVGFMHPNSLAWRCPFGPRSFTITISIIMT